MPGYPAPLGKFIAFDDLGNPLVGGQVWTYQAGTSTPVQTFTTAALNIANSNPVILDAAGRASIWIYDASQMTYKFVVKNSLGVIQYTEDNISIPVIPQTVISTAVPPGAILPYGGAAAPEGYLLCDGASYARGDYPLLYPIILDKFGSVDANSFNVPDLRERFPMGVRITGLGSSRGDKGGEFDHKHRVGDHSHTIAAHQHPMSHTHGVSRDGWGNAVQTSGSTHPGNRLLTSPQTLNLGEATTDGIATAGTMDVNHTGDNTVGLTTGNQVPPATMTLGADPPWIAVNFIIKYN